MWKALSLEPSFCYISETIYNNDKANIMTSIKNDLKYLCAFLNSKIFQFLFKQIGINMGSGYEYKIQFLEKIPVPPITPSNEPIVRQIESLVDKILSLTQSDDYMQNPAKQAQVKEYERQIDRMVYKLYGLTEEEIKIVEGE